MFKYIALLLTALGFLHIIADFCISVVLYYKGRHRSMTPFVGLILGLIGIAGMKFSGASWHAILVLLTVLIFVYIAFHFIFPRYFREK